jgi:toxin CcdB
MAQFDVFENPNSDSSERIPYLLDVQSNLLSQLASRVVVPLSDSPDLKGRAAQRLHPLFSIRGRSVMMLTHQLAAVPASRIGNKVTNLSGTRDEIIAALDFLITGI